MAHFLLIAVSANQSGMESYVYAFAKILLICIYPSLEIVRLDAGRTAAQSLVEMPLELRAGPESGPQRFWDQFLGMPPCPQPQHW